MIITEAQQRIDSLEKALPSCFSFVFDTTDRTFLYKSVDRNDCTEIVLKLDQVEGIDKLMESVNFFECVEDRAIILLRKLNSNVFLGTCIHLREYSSDQLDIARSIIIR